MSTTTSVTYADRRTVLSARAADYLELTKPRIGVLVLLTVAVSSLVAGNGWVDSAILSHTLLGTALVAASASALNQLLERKSDAKMPRTADRPLPGGRLSGRQVLWFGGVTIVAGAVYLAVAVNLLTAALGLLTWAMYVWIYTPLKSRTPANTAVGAVAGALPVLMGCSAAGAPLGLSALTLFLIVYLWQFPHFMAIAWIYRLQYRSAGLQMLPSVDLSGWRAGRQAIVAGLALLPVSLLPALSLEHGGGMYFAWALALGLGQLACAAAFFARRSDATARRLLRASLVYLPALWGLLVVCSVN